MRTRKSYPQMVKRIYRPELTHCLECQTRLRRCRTISQRMIITLTQVIALTHCGYSCPLPTCPGYKHLYRSTEADALALPGFTFGLDVILLVGQLRLKEHKTVDEMHQVLIERLAPLGQSISRREMLFLFEAYTALLRAGTEVSQDAEWRAEVLTNNGLLLSVDGILPDKGNETIYLVRDVFTGRILTAENVTESTKESMKQVLAPVVALDLPIMGVISDAQSTELQAVAELWPETPHQICQFHALREAGRLIYVLDHRVKTEMRIRMQQKTHEYRQDLHKRMRQTKASKEVNEEEEAQLAVLEDYAAMVEGALNMESLPPFGYGGLAMQDGLTQIQSSLTSLEKKRGSVTELCEKRLTRLKTIVSLHEEKQDTLSQVRAMREWIMEAEHILGGSWATEPEEISNAEVGRRLDEWLHRLARFVEREERTEDERFRLGHLLKVMTHLRPGLVQCYDVKGFPRTNNDMERTIRAIKMHSRRISGRKNWNSYLLRYGRCVVYHEWWHQQPDGETRLHLHLPSVDPVRWRHVRQETRTRHQEQLNRSRFRHHPLAYLASLEARWEQPSCT
jgi:hypothetical protein